MSRKPVEKAADLARKGAVITLHPYLPPKQEQMDAALDWGIRELMAFEMDVSPIWTDDVRRTRTTNWPNHLPEREQLLNAYRRWQCPGHVIFFANPLCVGFSKLHAQSVIDVLHAAQVSMYVHDAQREYRAGDDLSGFWKEQARQLKNAQMRKYRR